MIALLFELLVVSMGFVWFAFVLMLCLAVANAISTLFECGPGVCADPPTDYKLINDVTNKG